MADSFSFKRSPSVYRSVKDIDPEKDSRVRLLGKVVNKKDDLLFLDDGTGTAEIVMMNDFDVAIGETVRIFCRVLPLEDGYELRGEVIQKMDSLDVELYKKAVEKFRGD